MINHLRYALFISLLILAPLTVSASFDLVRNNKAMATIVVPDKAFRIVTSAASELQYHVKESTGVTLPIINEAQKPSSGNLIYLGPCQETARAGLHPEKLPPNAFMIKLIGKSLFLTGHDSEGEPFWILHGNWTRVGTLFAVYEFLEQQLGCRWLWPGKLGEVIPRHSTITINQLDQTHIPQIIHSRWRDGGTAGVAGWASPQVRSQYLQAQGMWLRRQRFAMGINMDIRHSFTGHWTRFNTSHPEYFNLLPDGKRRSDPFYCGGAETVISMSVAEPALWQQIIKDWKANRTAEIPFIDASENDTNGKCLCEKCLAWDIPDPKAPVAFSDRVSAAKKAFAAGEAQWEHFLGSLSDRYARFYLAVQKEAQKIDPDITVMGLSYANYVKPPLKTKLNDHITVAIVPELMFPWTEEKRRAFRKQWDGWHTSGATLMLRPNYTWDGHGYPINYARKLGEDFSYATRRSLIATDFDSLTGQWATQGPNHYVLGRLHAHPEWSVNQALEEYYQGFGKASGAVKNYFAYWERISDGITDQTLEKAVKQKDAVSTSFVLFHRFASVIFTPEVMSKGRKLLVQAKTSAQGDAIAEKRVAFLEKGLENSELTLAVQEAFDQYRKTGNIAGYRGAMEALDEFRKEVEGEYIANMNTLAFMEAQTWDRSLLALLKQPGELLPAVWKFQWDPNSEGVQLGWTDDQFKDAKWFDIRINSAYEKQDVGKQWFKEHGRDYFGFCWYRTQFQVKPSLTPQDVRLIFGAVDEACTVWVNGQLVLERPYPYQGNTNSWQEAFEADVTKVIRTDRPNILAVRVENKVGDGGIWKPVWLLQSTAPVLDERNLIKDGGFEKDPTAWNNQTQCGEITYALDSSQLHHGKKIGTNHLHGLGASRGGQDLCNACLGALVSGRHSSQVGKNLSIAALGENLKRFYGSGSSLDSFEWSEGDKSLNLLNTEGMWKEITIDEIVPESEQLGLYLNLMDGTGTVWFDDVELVERE